MTITRAGIRTLGWITGRRPCSTRRLGLRTWMVTFRLSRKTCTGRMQHRESASPSKPPLPPSHKLDESQSYDRSDQSLVYGTMADISAQSCSPLTVPHTMGSRSGVTTPAPDASHPAAALSHAEQNGYSSAQPHCDEGGHSPAPSRSSHLQKLHKMQPIDTDPDQGASLTGQESHPFLSRSERMAALERRMVANGLSAPGRSRGGTGKKRLGQAGATHVGAVQMNDCSVTSGSESSESEAETNRGNCSSPLMFGNAAEAGSNSPLPRNKFSFGSLQLDEEADEDSHVFSDDDSGQIFSC